MFLLVCYCICAFVPTISNAFNGPAVYQITEPVQHAEGPTWDSKKNMLFFVDMHRGRVFSYNYVTTAVNFIQLDGDVAPVIPAEHNNNLLLVGLNRSLVAVEWDGTNKIGKQKILTTVSKQFPLSRFNDGKADKQGRLWIGTTEQNRSSGAITSNHGVFYKITKTNLNDPTVEIAPVNISNGLAWNAANNKLYYIDTSTLQVDEFDYDDANGTISNRRVAFDLNNYPELTGQPDGMTIDVEDKLWVALFGGGCVIRVDPENGKLLQRINLPARYVTSAIWGGPNLDVLFVTTSRLWLTEEETRYYAAAGSVLAITNLKTKGKPVFNVDIVDSI